MYWYLKEFYLIDSELLWDNLYFSKDLNRARPCYRYPGWPKMLIICLRTKFDLCSICVSYMKFVRWAFFSKKKIKISCFCHQSVQLFSKSRRNGFIFSIVFRKCMKIVWQPFSPYNWCMELYDNDFCCMELYGKHFRCMEVNPGMFQVCARLKPLSRLFFSV